MLAHRIIPVMLQRGATLVKGRQFRSWRSVGHAKQAVAIHQARGVDELIYLDIGATPEGRGPDFATVERLTAGCFMPITVGGGVKSLEDVRGLLNAGADKVAVCSWAPAIIAVAARTLGCQAIVASIDVVHGLVAWNGAQAVSNINPVDYAKKCADEGAGEILLTCVEREGMMEGYDLELLEAISKAVDVPVIANGGAGTYEHMHEALRAGASAVAAGSMFQFTDATPRGAAEYLAHRGVPVRL